MKKILAILVLGLVFGVRMAHAATYQLAIASATETGVAVSSFGWTEVDAPQLIGRTAIEIQNVDVSSSVECAFTNSGPLAGLTTSYHVIPVATAATSYPDWSLSLSNFSSTQGGYPVSASIPVYCTTGKVGSSATVIVTQTK